MNNEGTLSCVQLGYSPQVTAPIPAFASYLSGGRGHKLSAVGGAPDGSQGYVQVRTVSQDKLTTPQVLAIREICKDLILLNKIIKLN